MGKVIWWKIVPKNIEYEMKLIIEHDFPIETHKSLRTIEIFKEQFTKQKKKRETDSDKFEFRAWII